MTAEDLRAQAAPQELLTAVLDNLTDAVVACDAEGRLTLFNRATADLHGLPAEPLPADEWAQHYDLYHPDGSTPMQTDDVPLVRALRGERVVDVPMCIVPKGRPPRHLVASGQQIRAADGTLVGAVVIMHDVTELQQLAEQQQVAQLQALNDAALAIGRVDSVEAALQALVKAATSLVPSHQGVASITKDQDWAQAIAAVELSDEYAAWRDYATPPDGSGIYALVCETNLPVRLTQAELEAHPRWRGFGPHGPEHPPMRGWLAAPLVGRDGRNLGLVQLSDRVRGDFDAEDEALLVQLARLASATLETLVAYEQEHSIAAELQRSLLPDVLPDLPGLSTCARYLPATTGAQVGGDWHDAFALPGGRTAVVLGDVMGHGLRSATVMGQIRTALRAYALADPSPAVVAAHLDALVDDLAQGDMATMAYGVLTDGRLDLVLAGHPPPLLRRADGSVTQLDAEPGLPLGALPGTAYTSTSYDLEPGSTLLLFSDGLVETRSRPLDAGLEQLRAAFAAAPVPPEQVCDAVLAALTSAGTDDDVAVLAVTLG